MKKQKYILSIIGIISLVLIINGCSAPSTNTAANVSNKTNPNIPLTNANATTSGNTNAAATTNGTNVNSR